MKKITILIFIIFIYSFCRSQNPIVPPGEYIADPSAHVWKDGKLYVYSSNDESRNYYCSWKYDVLYTSDLIHWTLVKNSFSSKGEGEDLFRIDWFRLVKAEN